MMMMIAREKNQLPAAPENPVFAGRKLWRERKESLVQMGRRRIMP